MVNHVFYAMLRTLEKTPDNRIALEVFEYIEIWYNKKKAFPLNKFDYKFKDKAQLFVQFYLDFPVLRSQFREA